ncbi:All-trans-retinol 13,14-reductase [Desulfovibrio sp. X2]|uniref:phytoene desaturase family protein n=1 Tax=Desulfovibrio sp. X2 TaxID=941449 RepID=UPI000358F15C|nr:NAD(P)/FAD-dependent oxidoreductase [Desulfovibrio sp. X2]EPR40870.1 All-trans-retinol 13,14-reductase [Desulfovibrio sp. X2]
MDRRFFLRLSLFAAASALVGWRPSPARAASSRVPGEYDAVIVGAGLGGLTCAAYMARNGYRPLVLEKQGTVGGYAGSFTRSAGGAEFTCEISLHASALTTPDSTRMLEDVGVRDKIDIVPHPHAWVSRFPDFTVEVPARTGLDGFERQLAGMFPAERQGLADYFGLWRGVMAELAKLDKGLSREERAEFPRLFPNLWAIRDKTVGQLIDARLRDPRARAVLAQSSGYYGLPPSRLAAFYYLAPTADYLTYGGDYIKGTSQSLSDALADAVRAGGGEVVLDTAAVGILVENGRAVGVRADDGRDYRGRAVAVNSAAPDLLAGLLPQGALPEKQRRRMAGLSPSPSSFIVWLGLDRDITRDFRFAEMSCFPGTDLDASWQTAMDCDLGRSGFSLMVYDNLIRGYSPPGHTSLSIMSLTGYDHWKPFEAAYHAGDKKAYDREKARLTALLVERAERLVLPGLSKMIVMQDSSTPLTNVRFTGNTAGALYGYNQTPDNSFMTRLPNRTGVPGLYLCSAWGDPGGGYGGVMLGGKKAFREMVEDWG